MERLKFIVDRLKEPSTFAGFAAIAMAFGVNEAEYNSIVFTIAGIAGLVSIFLTEKGSE